MCSLVLVMSSFVDLFLGCNLEEELYVGLQGCWVHLTLESNLIHMPTDISVRKPVLDLTFSLLIGERAKGIKKNNTTRNSENMTSSEVNENENEMSVLDLPNLALECILEKLEPDGLCKMACVCSYLRDMCLSDHLWEDHMKKRWGRVIGDVAYKEWQLHIASKKQSNYFLDGENRKVSCYRALQTGKFWFPAQVFNRENGHVGFMLSCYDADLSYDSHTDTFQARYPPHGRRAAAIETGVTWDRLRAPPVDNSPHDLHISDCLNDLRPKDHIEIQWRRNKQFPYGWWYGVVGHLEACDGNQTYCHCHENDTVVLEFNQYAPGSRWRHTMIHRKEHREEGNEADGFYGGIRKLNRKDEISMWEQFWPAEILE
ncbi:unnamed protein product [Lactuca saligna]|uniref:F-box domain-containing protein n=1 Tax=Lactuca saligna TaxID=75948 RepID=A0AA35V589_LACSI|nr:unnamed protein product [Lactuca saligna]